MGLFLSVNMGNEFEAHSQYVKLKVNENPFANFEKITYAGQG